MGSGSRTPKIRRIEAQNKKKARIKRLIETAKVAAKAVRGGK